LGLQNKAVRLADVIDQLEKRNSAGAKFEAPLIFSPKTETFRSYPEFPGSHVRVEFPPTTIAAAKSMAEVNDQQLKKAQEWLGEAWAKQLKEDKGYNDTRYLVVTTITRVTVVLVIVFLVQILVGLYRYNYRLATFYDSRRDILRVWDGNAATLEKLEKTMSPHIDFGKEPKHPIEEIIQKVVEKIPMGTNKVNEK
jgi:hypothetical protein